MSQFHLRFQTNEWKFTSCKWFKCRQQIRDSCWRLLWSLWKVNINRRLVLHIIVGCLSLCSFLFILCTNLRNFQEDVSNLRNSLRNIRHCIYTVCQFGRNFITSNVQNWQGSGHSSYKRLGAVFLDINYVFINLNIIFFLKKLFNAVLNTCTFMQ